MMMMFGILVAINVVLIGTMFYFIGKEIADKRMWKRMREEAAKKFKGK